MNSNANKINEDSSEQDSDSLKDEIGDESLWDKNESISEYAKGNKFDNLPRLNTDSIKPNVNLICSKSARYDTKQEVISSDQNFVRRQSIFDIGSFGSASMLGINRLASRAPEAPIAKQTFYGESTNGLGKCKSFISQGKLSKGESLARNPIEELKEEHESIKSPTSMSQSQKDTSFASDSEDDDEKNCWDKYFFCRAHKTKIKWDLWIIVLAIVNCIQVPYNVAFNSNTEQNIPLDVFNGIIDIMFMIDIFINFRSSYIVEETGDEIRDCKSIALNYMKGRFWIDLVACLPLDFLSYAISDLDENDDILEFIGLLKLVRVLRLSRLIPYLNLKSDLKMSIKLGKLIFFLIVYLHWLACFWFYIVKINEKWIPPLDYVYIVTDVYDRNAFFQYSTSLYHAVLMLGGNDIGPRGEFQLMFVVVILILGAIINASIFGNIAVLIQSINRKAATFQEKIENANDTMKNLRVPEKIQDEVKSYLTYTQSTLDHQNEYDNFLNMLSPSLKKQISKHINYDALVNNTIFCDNDEMIKIILNDLSTNLYLPEDEIIIQGTPNGDKMFFIAKGDWDVFVLDENSKTRSVKTLWKGDYFGEIALLKDCRRTASVHSKNYATCAVLTKDSMNELLDKYPNIKESFERFITISYNDKWHKFKKRCLKNVDYLGNSVSERVLDEISYRLEPIHVNKDSFLFKAGTQWRDIHIITSGEIKVYVHNNNRDTYLDTLYVGWIVGSYSSLTSDYYTMSGKCDSDCKILRLGYKDLAKIRADNDDLDQMMALYENYWDENGLPYCDYKLHRNRILNMSPIQKFRLGIKRIMSIVKSYKSSALTELLQKVAEKVKEDKKSNENKRKNRLRRVSIQNSFEERAEMSLIALTEKVEKLKDTVEKQNDVINLLKDQIFDKMDSLNLVRLESTDDSDSDSLHSNEAKNQQKPPRDLKKTK